MNLEYLKANKDKVIAEKKATYKEADGIAAHSPSGVPERLFITHKDEFGNCELKSEPLENWQEKDHLEVKCVINACGLIDSHQDLHIKGIWDDFIKTNPTRTKHLQEHRKTFDAIIAKGTDLKAQTEDIAWKALGFNYEGKTQCLTFDSTVRKDQHAYMFEQYGKGNVEEHSVGMSYGEVLLCVNSEEKYWTEEKENWDQYIGEAVNPEKAEAWGWFWAVKTASFTEGSAVVFGSNAATPTQSIKGSAEQDKEINENEREIDAQKLRTKRLRLLELKD